MTFDAFAKLILEGIEDNSTSYNTSEIMFESLYTRALENAALITEAKCTGPTKKASSNRKGKKWTKCARQPDGSYKRIHWGQAGVRVGKNNPKRRKSFRARHKCSSAKAGSPKAAACSDW
jgi:hypothetical protein